MKPGSYIPQIDFLRAIAVLSVFIFHIDENWLPGGFTGVDIFFVISGFLITSILDREYASSGCFRISNFYNRRIKRILPLFFSVLSLSLVSGYLLFLPKDFSLLAKSVTPALFFFSNFFFSGNVDYFSNNSNEYPLLHMWSLSIEEQFYFFWPWLLIFFRRYIPRKVLPFVVTSIIFIFLLWGDLARVFSLVDSDLYFASVTRFAEIMIGCLLAILSKSEAYSKFVLKNRTFYFVSGMVLILSAIFFISKQSAFPGLLCLVPGLGAFFLISVFVQKGSPERIEAISFWKPLILIGQYSYAIYLWHWPLLAFFRYYTGRYHLEGYQNILVITLTFLFSYLSSIFIEKPVIRLSLSFRKAFFLFLVAPFVFFYLVSDKIMDSKGLENRVRNLPTLDKETKYLSEGYCHNLFFGDCQITHLAGGSRVLLFGDSNAGQFMPYWKVIAKDKYNVVAVSADTCPPILDISEDLRRYIQMESDQNCLKIIDRARSLLNKNDVVVLAANWGEYFRSVPAFSEDLRKTLKILSSKKVLIMGRIPTFKEEYFNSYLRQKYAPLDSFLQTDLAGRSKDLIQSVKPDPINDKLYQMSNEFKNVTFLNPADFGHPFWQEAPLYNNTLGYKDAVHLNEYGSTVLGEFSKTQILDLMSKLNLSK